MNNYFHTYIGSWMAMRWISYTFFFIHCDDVYTLVWSSWGYIGDEEWIQNEYKRILWWCAVLYVCVFVCRCLFDLQCIDCILVDAFIVDLRFGYWVVRLINIWIIFILLEKNKIKNWYEPSSLKIINSMM